MPVSRALQAAAAAHVFVSIGHTVKAQEWMNDAQFKRLPRSVAMYARAGWFQGSVFFLITGKGGLFAAKCTQLTGQAGLINYRWAQNSLLLKDRFHQAIAVLATAICWGSALWYGKEGDQSTAGFLTIVGGLQSGAAFLAAS